MELKIFIVHNCVCFISKKFQSKPLIFSKAKISDPCKNQQSIISSRLRKSKEKPKKSIVLKDQMSKCENIIKWVIKTNLNQSEIFSSHIKGANKFICSKYPKAKSCLSNLEGRSYISYSWTTFWMCTTHTRCALRIQRCTVHWASWPV